MAERAVIPAVSLALGLALMGGARMVAAPGDTGLVDRQDVRALRERVRTEVAFRESVVAGVREQLEREGLAAGRIDALVPEIRRRMTRELEGYAGLLRGRRFDTLDQAYSAIEARERILAHTARSAPIAYGEGRPRTFVVDSRHAERLELSVGGMIRARESGLREAAEDLRDAGQATAFEVRMLQERSRTQALSRGKRVLDEMRGAAFFSESDAARYLQEAIGAELDAIRSRLRDPAGRRALLDSAPAQSGVPGS